MRISDWSSDVCSSDLTDGQGMSPAQPGGAARHRGDAAGLAAGQDAAEVATGTMGRGAGRTGAARGHASSECTRGGGRGQEPDPRTTAPAPLQTGTEHGKPDPGAGGVEERITGQDKKR